MTLGCQRMFYDTRSDDTFVCGTVGICDQCRRALLDEIFRRARRERETDSGSRGAGRVLRGLFSDRDSPTVQPPRREGDVR